MIIRSLATAAILACNTMAASAANFTLTSPDISEGGTLAAAQVGNGFGCSGGNLSPSFSWSNAPADTKSFVITVYDPDAPTGSGFWHWVMFNIPSSVNGLPGGITPQAGASDGAVQSRADAGFPGYVGACPPEGTSHRYIFTVIALGIDKLPLDSNASGALIGFMANANALAKASITVTYGR